MLVKLVGQIINSRNCFAISIIKVLLYNIAGNIMLWKCGSSEKKITVFVICKKDMERKSGIAVVWEHGFKGRGGGGRTAERAQ